MITWLETNVPAIRHVVVPNPGGRRWLELWNMAITQKAEEYYRIVNNLLDNSGGRARRCHVLSRVEHGVSAVETYTSCR